MLGSPYVDPRPVEKRLTCRHARHRLRRIPDPRRNKPCRSRSCSKESDEAASEKEFHILQEAVQTPGYRPTWTTRVTPKGNIPAKKWRWFLSDLMKGLSRNGIPSYRRTHTPRSHLHDHLLHRAHRTDARAAIQAQIQRSSKKYGIKVHFSITPIRCLTGMIRYITTATKDVKLQDREVFWKYYRASSYSRNFFPTSAAKLWLSLRERWYPGSTQEDERRDPPSTSEVKIRICSWPGWQARAGPT